MNKPGLTQNFEGSAGHIEIVQHFEKTSVKRSGMFFGFKIPAEVPQQSKSLIGRDIVQIFGNNCFNDLGSGHQIVQLVHETYTLQMIGGWHVSQGTPKFGRHYLWYQCLLQNTLILTLRDKRHHHNNEIGFITYNFL